MQRSDRTRRVAGTLPEQATGMAAKSISLRRRLIAPAPLRQAPPTTDGVSP